MLLMRLRLKFKSSASKVEIVEEVKPSMMVHHHLWNTCEPLER